MRRRQLKVLVEVHAADEGLGGNLTTDEIFVVQVLSAKPSPVRHGTDGWVKHSVSVAGRSGSLEENSSAGMHAS